MNYFVNKTYQWETPECICVQKDLLESFIPPTFESTDYKNWIAILDLKTCMDCRKNHGKIYEIDEQVDNSPPIHERCRCDILRILAAFAGTATQDGLMGADYIVKLTGELPTDYITKREAKALGWVSWQGNLDKVAPDKSIGGEVYRNRNGHLPDKLGRIWYEADINYNGGFRNNHRLIFSNDGLIFATYDHYMTFVQIQ